METIAQPTRVLYTAQTHTSGGREHGTSKSSDGHLDISLSPPGTDKVGTNPEQLFAAGWSACFEGAIGVAARRMKITLMEGPVIDAEVDLASNKTDLFLQARLYITIPGLDRQTAQSLVDAASGICPYSKAIKGNISVEYNLV